MFAFHLWPGGKEIGEKFRRLLDDAPLRHSKNLARQARCAFATQQPDRQNGRSHNYWTAVDELLESFNQCAIWRIALLPLLRHFLPQLDQLVAPKSDSARFFLTVPAQ